MFYFVGKVTTNRRNSHKKGKKWTAGGKARAASWPYRSFSVSLQKLPHAGERANFLYYLTPDMKYPIGLQDFVKIRQGNYVYVDKTRFIHDLATNGCYYFLSRPRRFGKSLLLSTMEAYFGGRKELFEGLAIEALEQDWHAYPILYLDLNTSDYRSGESLDEILNFYLCEWEKRYGANPAETTAALRFKGIVRRAAEATGRQVVILVDEYDKPLLQTVDNEPLQAQFRTALKAFYSVLKTQDRYIRFAFLTGVTKFSKVSIFSDLNNLNDISMNPRFQTICGISETELHAGFDAAIRELAATQGLTFGACCERLREQYDGYRFTPGGIGMYNPFSLLNVFFNLSFGDYWFETGTPTFLVRMLQKAGTPLDDLSRRALTADKLNSLEPDGGDPLPVLYQSGYLTIKAYDPEFKLYTLGYPNKEVEEGFINFLLPGYLNNEAGSTVFDIRRFVADVRDGRPQAFMERLQAFFADCDYRIAGKAELYFQNAMYLVFKTIGFYTEVERHTADGRIDILLQTARYVYIFELKLDGTAQEALQQINEKRYATPFAADARHLYKIGVNFSSATRGIADYLIEG